MSGDGSGDGKIIHNGMIPVTVMNGGILTPALFAHFDTNQDSDFQKRYQRHPKIRTPVGFSQAS